MKVRHTEIDDFFEGQSKSYKKQGNKSFQRHSARDIKDSLSEDEEDEPKVYRQMLHLPEFGTVISLFGIESIEKAQRFVDTLNDPRFQYGIIINKDMTPSERYPKVNVEAWFEKESVRDKRYDQLLDNLINAGYKITNI